MLIQQFASPVCLPQAVVSCGIRDTRTVGVIVEGVSIRVYSPSAINSRQSRKRVCLIQSWDQSQHSQMKTKFGVLRFHRSFKMSLRMPNPKRHDKLEAYPT